MVITVLIGHGATAAANWVAQHGLTYLVLYDQDYDVWEDYDEEGYIPLNLIISKDFVILYKEVGFNQNEIKEYIERNL